MTAQRPSRSWWWELSPAASMSWNDITPVTTFALCFLYLIINIGRGRRDLDLGMSLASPLLFFLYFFRGGLKRFHDTQQLNPT